MPLVFVDSWGGGVPNLIMETRSLKLSLILLFGIHIIPIWYPHFSPCCNLPHSFPYPNIFSSHTYILPLKWDHLVPLLPSQNPRPSGSSVCRNISRIYLMPTHSDTVFCCCYIWCGHLGPHFPQYLFQVWLLTSLPSIYPGAHLRYPYRKFHVRYL